MSLLELYLDPLRTSSTRMRAPAVTEVWGPMPSRFDFLPTVRIPIQWLAERTWFTRRLGTAFRFVITAEIRPSFHKSPIARPRDEARALMPGPAPAEMSANAPLPRLW